MVQRIRSDAGLYGYERALRRVGFHQVAGADEAGRGACAGPLVAAAVILDPRRAIPGLADSKLLTARRRDQVYEEVVGRALSWSVVAVEPSQCDLLGMHRANLTALRRAVGRLSARPEFVLTDGFAVDGLPSANLAVWKGDRVAGCIAAASVIAKVTRDRIMAKMHEQYPGYAFDIHKGYCTALHQERLEEWGPSPVHRWCFGNVRAAAQARSTVTSFPPSADGRVVAL